MSPPKIEISLIFCIFFPCCQRKLRGYFLIHVTILEFRRWTSVLCLSSIMCQYCCCGVISLSRSSDRSAISASHTDAGCKQQLTRAVSLTFCALSTHTSGSQAKADIFGCFQSNWSAASSEHLHITTAAEWMCVVFFFQYFFLHWRNTTSTLDGILSV